MIYLRLSTLLAKDITQCITSSLFILSILIAMVHKSVAIRCYQCSSDQDKNNDVCGTYTGFDKTRNVPVECQDDEAVTPGIFCVKIVQQGPRGFIWDGRWRTVIRRCASVSETGVTGVCNWGHHENGVYWEECYCSEDACNSASGLFSSSLITAVVFMLSAASFAYRWIL